MIFFVKRQLTTMLVQLLFGNCSLSISISVHLSVCLSHFCLNCLAISLSLCLALYLYLCVCVYLFVCLFSHCLFFCPTVFPPTSDLSVLLSCALLSIYFLLLLPGYQAVSHNVIAWMCVRKCNSKLRFAFRSSAAISMARNSFSLVESVT